MTETCYAYPLNFFSSINKGVGFESCIASTLHFYMLAYPLNCFSSINKCVAFAQTLKK